MPIISQTQIIILTAGGGTQNLPTTSPIDLYIIQGSATLTSNWTIQTSGGAPVEGMEYRFKYEADINLNGNNIIIFGETLPSTLSDKDCTITAYYNGSDWNVTFHASMDEAGSIPASLLPSNEFKFIITPHTMGNGEASPTVAPNLGAPYGNIANTNLAVRAVEGSNILEIKGAFEISPVDEVTLTSGTGFLYKILDTTFLPVIPRFFGAIARKKTAATPTYENVNVRMASGDPTGAATDRGIWLIIDDELTAGSYAAVEYDVYIDMKIDY